MRTLRLLVGLSATALGVSPPERPAVLVYTFDEQHPRMVRDVSGHRQHAVCATPIRYVRSPAGWAAQFDGSGALVAGSTDRLVVTDELTLDVWLRTDDAEAQGCVIDKKGERYRIAVQPGGGFFFGLKGDGGRADLNGTGLQPGQWHRVTATFKRPRLTVYLDGRKLKSMDWDHPIGPGGDLYIGAKSGSHDFFRGAVDRIHVYDYARSPRPGDETAYDSEGGTQVQRKLTVEQRDGDVRIDTGAVAAVLSRRTGAVESLNVAGKALVARNRDAPVFAEVMESDAYDGLLDAVPRRFLDGAWAFEGFRVEEGAEHAEAVGAGTLTFPGGDALGVTLRYRFRAGARHVEVGVTLSRRGAFRQRTIRSVGVRQPLALAERKRVVQAGDQGVRWDVRHHYQFHMHVGFMEEPDHNWWRHFFVDQESDHSYSMWRSEALDTSGLHSFRGRRAAGWTCAYDREGGALFAYRDLGRRAPKCLYVNAEGGGTGVVYFRGPTHPAVAVDAPAAEQGVFGAEHRIDWVFFRGEEAFERPARDLADLWGVESLPSDGPNRFEPVDAEVDLWDSPAAPGSVSPIVQGGVPLPRGAVGAANQARLFVDGREAPLHAVPVAYWPDQSIKWLLLCFPIRPDLSLTAVPGQGEGDEVRFRVTRRLGEDVPCRLVFGADVHAGALGTAVSVSEQGDGVVLDTGPLRVGLGPGERWIRSAVLNGREILGADGGPQAYVDFLRPGAGGYATGTTHPVGVEDPGPVRITKVEVEEDTGLRAVVRLEGMAEAQERARVIIRLEVWAGRPFLRLFHSVEFLHDDPRAVFVRRMGLRIPLGTAGGERRCTAGGQAGPVVVPAAASVGLRQPSHLNYEVWRLEKGGRWPEIVESKWRSRGWLDVTGPDGGLCVVQRDMWQEFPKELRYDSADGALQIGYWPDTHRLMDCRRYSNYPHRSQGESTPADARWVVDNYYKNDPFKGTTKTHETILFFHDGTTSPEALDSVAADFQSRPLVHAGWEWCADTGITMPLPSATGGEFPRFNANALNVALWWLFHQRVWGWYGMWDYGDVGHKFRSGYGRVFPADTLKSILSLPAKERAGVKPGGKYAYRQDYFTQNDWAYDNGRWGWSNTEGLVNHYASLMYLRTGRRDLFFFMEANARHVRDVDARHAGTWFGRGTRHGVQHWSDGNHEERQTTFSEQRFHYLLTGEPRTREWNRTLADEYYLKTTCHNHASHSGRSYGLLTRWEITGEPELGRVMRDYMHALATPEGIAISTQVSFPDAKPVGPAREVNGGSMFFHTFGGMHAVLEYYYLTEDPVIRDSLLRTAEYALRKGDVGGMYRKVLAFAARHAPEPEPYRKALATWCAEAGSRYVYQQVPANREHWTGDTGFLVGNVSGGLFWANDSLYVLGALEREPALDAEREAAMREVEERPVAAHVRLPLGSWQTEYDAAEFGEYLRDRLREGPGGRE